MGKNLVVAGKVKRVGVNGKSWVTVNFAFDKEWAERKDRLEKKIDKAITYRELTQIGIEHLEGSTADTLWGK